jgi:hypothetical protein
MFLISHVANHASAQGFLVQVAQFQVARFPREVAANVTATNTKCVHTFCGV